MLPGSRSRLNGILIVLRVRPISLLVAGVFAVIDVGFFSANMLKVAAGGWVPLVMGGTVYAAMLIWHKGYEALLKVRRQTGPPLDQVLKEMNTGQVTRVPGTAVFLTPSELDVPPVLAWHVMKNRALHETVFILNVSSELVPYVPAEGRVTLQEIAPRVAGTSSIWVHGEAGRSLLTAAGPGTWLPLRSIGRGVLRQA